MNTKVRVVADKNGNVIGVSQNNPEYGYIRVEQNALQLNNEGWLRIIKKSALIKGKVEDLVECKYKDGDEIGGKIIIVESLTPFNPENPDRDLKIAGATGVICRIDDQPIYRQTFLTFDENAQDQLLLHTNRDEIKEVMQAQSVLDDLGIKEPNL